MKHALAVVTVSLIAFSACGGSSDDNGVASINDGKPSNSQASQPKGKIGPEDAKIKYAKCMRANGVNMTDKGYVSYDNAALFEKARNACKKWEEMSSDYRDPLDPKVMDAKAKYAQCMRKLGQDVSDPDPKDGSYTLPRNHSSREFYRAMQKCKHLLPNRG